MDRLAGRTAFITGGARGIGLGIARALARAGVRIALADVDPDALDRARAELSAHTPTEGFVLDVRDRDRYARVADDVGRRLGPVSLLVNNAGVTGDVPVTELTYERWDWVLGVNLLGVVNGVQTFVPRMIERGDAHIVNTSSMAGLVHSGVTYTTSKFAVVGLSEALQHGLRRHGIGVSVLCPSYVATGIIDNSAALYPAGDGAESAATTARRERSKAALAGGTSSDAVGELVRAAVEADQLYVFTDGRFAKALQQRNRMLLAALPPGTSARTESASPEGVPCPRVP